MSNGYFNFANSKEFHDLMLNLHPSNDAAFEYGLSYGKDFDPDYKSIIEVHSYEAPKAMHLNANFPLEMAVTPLLLQAHTFQTNENFKAH